MLDDPAVAQLDRFVTSVANNFERISNILKMMQERVDQLQREVESQDKAIMAICKKLGIMQ